MVCALPSMTKDESQIMSQESTLLTTHTGANLKSIKFHTVVNTLSIFQTWLVPTNTNWTMLLDNISITYQSCVIGQYASCAVTVVTYFAKVTEIFFYENLWWITSLYLKFCHSFDWLVTRLHVIQFCLLSYL